MKSLSYIRKNYPNSYVNLYAAFVDRASQLSRPQGVVGAITSRSGFFLKSFETWRKRCLLDKTVLRLIAHLGQGVLDIQLW